jgi:hypothetical protein
MRRQQGIRLMAIRPILFLALAMPLIFAADRLGWSQNAQP